MVEMRRVAERLAEEKKRKEEAAIKEKMDKIMAEKERSRRISQANIDRRQLSILGRIQNEKAAKLVSTF